MASMSRAKERSRGQIETLPSGSLRVKVFTGQDPLTGKRNYLTETIPAGPTANRDAKKALTRLLAQVDANQAPKTRASVRQLLERYFEVIDVGDTTLPTYRGYVANHIDPLLGDLPLSKLDGEVLDSFYALLRTCRLHCNGKAGTDHRVAGAHVCDSRCGPHVCRPLKDSTLNQIHGILSGACKRAVRWRWMGVDPTSQAARPNPGRPDPQPPTPEQASRIANEAWRDPDWGMLVWLTFVSGARRGELCALTWDRIEFGMGVMTLRSSIAQIGARTWEKDTKTHQQRRITLDDLTVSLLRAYLRRCRERAESVGAELHPAARVFSLVPDGSEWLKPDSVTQRYSRMCARLGWDMNLHQLRHYSATELIASGVDVRTVAGRLGHSGGGTTTLRVYTAWVSEADQRAAGALAGRMPELPSGIQADGGLPVPAPPPVTEESAPYVRIAADLRAAITCGALPTGASLPTVADLARRYKVAASTAHRAIATLAEAGQVTVSRGKRAVVA